MPNTHGYKMIGLEEVAKEMQLIQHIERAKIAIYYNLYKNKISIHDEANDSSGLIKIENIERSLTAQQIADRVAVRLNTIRTFIDLTANA